MIKTFILLSSLSIGVLAGLLLLPEFAENAPIIAYLMIALAVITLLLTLSIKPATPVAATVEPAEAVEEKTAPQPAHPKIDAVTEQSGEVQVAQLLSLLQEKGRFLDFVMDDIKSYPDTQIAAAARFVHQGCQAVMQHNFKIEPVASVSENSALTLDADYPRSDYRLSGKIGTKAPLSGTLKHKGWKTSAINLPKVMGSKAQAKGSHLLAAAEVEVR
ncbi:MAG: hypothetical protein ACI81V_000878 [Lentimonas sp.]|jgi:hypothetical protein